MATTAAVQLRALCIHETTGAGDEADKTWLRWDADHLVLENDRDAVVVPPGTLEAIFTRFAHPLASNMQARLRELPELPIAAAEGGARIRPLRHLARYDVIARDYLVLERPSEEPLAELTTTVAAALTHILKLA